MLRRRAAVRDGWADLWSRLGAHRATLLVLLLGLLATAAAATAIQRLADAKDHERFANVVGQASDQIEGRLKTYSAVLRAGAGLFAADQPVTRSEFQAFAERLDLPQVYPGIQGLGFSVRTPDAGGPATRALFARMGVADLRLKASPAPGRAVHAIVFLEPLDRRNQAALGYDMFSDPVRREAMAQARDTGRAAMSRKVQLVQEIDPRKQAGFLMYQPVYAGGAVPDGLVERRAKLLGFVYSPFRADDLLAGIFAGQPNPRVAFAIYDGPVAPQNLLHASFTGSQDELAHLSWTRTRRTLHVAGRDWTIVFYATRAFELSSSQGLTLPFVFGGLFATLLVTGATARETRARLAAEGEVAARRKAEAQRQLLIAELNHRVKNTLAAVQAIAAQTIRAGADPRTARAAFEARLLALSHAHDLLTREHWQGARLEDLVRLELAPYRDGHSLSVEGDSVTLSPDQCVAMALAIHELTTNAAKYGALSTPTGGVAVGWTVRPRPDAPHLALTWTELGGPPVTAPTARGFGLRLLQQGVGRQLGAKVNLDFLREGLRCEIDLPLTDAPPREGSGVAAT